MASKLGLTSTLNTDEAAFYRKGLSWFSVAGFAGEIHTFICKVLLLVFALHTEHLLEKDIALG